MAGFGHGPTGPKEQEDAAVSARNARYGLLLFAIYFVVYAAFVAINAFWPDVMSRTFAGISLAVVGGLKLIVMAFVLALVYAWLCRTAAGSPADTQRGPSPQPSPGVPGEGARIPPRPPGAGGRP